MLLFVALHADFVAANDRLQAVFLAKSLGDIWAKLHTYTTFAGAAAWLSLGVCPEHLHHQTGLAGLALPVPVEPPDVV